MRVHWPALFVRVVVPGTYCCLPVLVQAGTSADVCTKTFYYVTTKYVSEYFLSGSAVSRYPFVPKKSKYPGQVFQQAKPIGGSRSHEPTSGIARISLSLEQRERERDRKTAIMLFLRTILQRKEIPVIVVGSAAVVGGMVRTSVLVGCIVLVHMWFVFG